MGTRNEKTLPLQFVLEEEGDLDRFAFGASAGLFSPRFRMSKELVDVRIETRRQGRDLPLQFVLEEKESGRGRRD